MSKDREKELPEQGLPEAAGSHAEHHKEATLDFDKLSADLTLEELAGAAEEVEETNIMGESPLDKYVRKHRAEVEQGKMLFDEDLIVASGPGLDEFDQEAQNENPSQTNEAKTSPSNLTAAPAQEEALSASVEPIKQGRVIFPLPLLAEEVAVDEGTRNMTPNEGQVATESVDSSRQDFDLIALAPVTESVDSREERKQEKSRSGRKPFFALSSKEYANKRRITLVVLVLLVIALIGGGLALYQASRQKAANQTAQSSKDAATLKSFETAYAAFFTDSQKTSLLNSHFDQLANLSKTLDKINPASKDFKTAQTEYNNLSSDIKSIQTINAIFDKAAINDGKLDTSAVLKTGATIPNTLSSKNSQLQSLLNQAIALAKSQQTTSPGTGTSSIGADTNTSSSDNSTADVVTAISQNPTGATVDDSNARVQVQSGLNLSDPAFTFLPGVLDNILNSARDRGYISGDNYILLPVAIHTTNGKVSGEIAGVVSGYYNLYSPSGAYIFSINAKTGYYFGNGMGLPLDYDN